jgi:tetratricopeptide (TPR) repeat protein
LHRRYPKGFNPKELSENDKSFFYNVFGKRGVINLFYENNYLEASDDLETVVKLMPTNEKDPNYYKVYTLLSSALIMQNRMKEAAEYYSKALYLYPDLPEKRHNEYVNICKSIVNSGNLELCPKCKDWDK